MSDLIGFLRARLDEDEALAQAAMASVWFSWLDWTRNKHELPGLADHIARHDPARVLREVEADRKLIHALTHPDPLQGPEYAAGLRLAAMFRAAVHSDHPDYQQEWRP